MKLSLEGCVVVLDEAHNVESVCSDATSFELSAVTVTNAVRELDRALRYVEHNGGAVAAGGGGGAGATNAGPPVSSDELLLLKQRVLRFEECVLAHLEQPGESAHVEQRAVGGVTYAGSEIFALFGADGLGVTHDNCRSQIDLLDRVTSLLADEADMAGRQAASTALHDITNAIHIAFRDTLNGNVVGGGDDGEHVTKADQNSSSHYRVHIVRPPPTADTPMRRGTATAGPTLHYWYKFCFVFWFTFICFAFCFVFCTLYRIGLFFFL